MFGKRTTRIGLVVVMVIAAVGIASPVSAARPPSCFGKIATIVGTNHDPSKSVVVKGTQGDDVIVGFAGIDRISAFGGDDLICPGGGDDFIRAGAGDDKVKGGGGMDTIYAADGKDRIWGQGNSDSLSGGRGNDRLFGGAQLADSLLGGPGNDLLDGGAGNDTAEFWESTAGVKANITKGTAVGEGKDDLLSIEGLIGSNFDDVLIGDERSNYLVGLLGDDKIYALGSSIGGGVDLLRSGGDEDFLDGGEGPDTLSYNLHPAPVVANLATGEATSLDFGHDTFVGIENLTGSRENDTLIGDDGDNIIAGNWGDDTLDGSGGTDEVAYFDAIFPVTADLSEGTAETESWTPSVPWVDTLANFENLSGSAWRDDLTGDDGPNLIWGGLRADVLRGLGGDDVLLGSLGVDEADGGDGDADECDAETELNCELDPSGTGSSTMSEALLDAPWGRRF